MEIDSVVGLTAHFNHSSSKVRKALVTLFARLQHVVGPHRFSLIVGPSLRDSQLSLITFYFERIVAQDQGSTSTLDESMTTARRSRANRKQK